MEGPVNETAVLEIGRDAVYVILKASAPTLIAGMAVGLIVALFQALTTIQEMTLTFVPKIVVILIAIIVSLPFMMNTVIFFANGLFGKMADLGAGSAP